jgi:hypothetical protein
LTEATLWTDHFSTRGPRPLVIWFELLLSLFGLKFINVSILDRNSLQSSFV